MEDFQLRNMLCMFLSLATLGIDRHISPGLPCLKPLPLHDIPADGGDAKTKLNDIGGGN